MGRRRSAGSAPEGQRWRRALLNCSGRVVAGPPMRPLRRPPGAPVARYWSAIVPAVGPRRPADGRRWATQLPIEARLRREDTCRPCGRPAVRAGAHRKLPGTVVVHVLHLVFRSLDDGPQERLEAGRVARILVALLQRHDLLHRRLLHHRRHREQHDVILWLDQLAHCRERVLCAGLRVHRHEEALRRARAGRERATRARAGPGRARQGAAHRREHDRWQHGGSFGRRGRCSVAGGAARECKRATWIGAVG